nr:hypothetical protein [Nocardioides convexus]
MGGRPVFTDPLREITDQVGVRVITYVHADVQAVADLLADEATVIDDRDMGQETASEGRFGYASRHLLIDVEGMDRIAQIQIRTVLQHAWAEFEHDIRYKGTIPDEHVPDFDRRFTLAAGLLELADREFSTIRQRIQQGVTASGADVADDDPRIPPREPGRLPRRAVRRRAALAHRPLRVDRRAGAGAWGSPRSRRWVTCCGGSTPTCWRSGWTTATRRAPYDGWTTRCCGPTARPMSSRRRTPTGWARCAPGWRRCARAEAEG